MKSKKFVLTFSLLFFLLSLVISIPSTNSQVGIGVSPGFIYFKNVLRDGYAENFFVVSVGSDRSVRVTATANGYIADWLEFPDGTVFEVNRTHPKKFRVIVRPPSDVANGKYTGFIRFTTAPLGKVTSGLGSAIEVSIDAKVVVEITDLQYLICKATSFTVSDVEKDQPVLLSFNLHNTGNVRVRPKVDITIWNKDQDKIVETFNLESSKEVLPTRKETIFFNFPVSSLDISQYWASITVKPCQDYALLPFGVFEPGTLGLDGILKTIITKVLAEPGEIIPIIAIFENVGKNPVKAKFKGHVEFGGRIIKLLESGEKIVNVGEEVNFTTYFTPKSPGRYVVKGRVFYGIKQTYENTGIINVLGTRVNWPVVIVYSTIVILLIIIIYRLYKRKTRLL